MEIMPYYSITSSARFCGERNLFESLDIIANIGSGKVDLISEDKKSVIRLDLNGAAELEDILRNITGSGHFQRALRKEISEHLGRLDAVNSAVL